MVSFPQLLAALLAAAMLLGLGMLAKNPLSLLPRCIKPRNLINQQHQRSIPRSQTPPPLPNMLHLHDLAPPSLRKPHLLH